MIEPAGSQTLGLGIDGNERTIDEATAVVGEDGLFLVIPWTSTSADDRIGEIFFIISLSDLARKLVVDTFLEFLS